MFLNQSIPNREDVLKTEWGRGATFLGFRGWATFTNSPNLPSRTSIGKSESSMQLEAVAALLPHEVPAQTSLVRFLGCAHLLASGSMECGGLEFRVEGL